MSDEDDTYEQLPVPTSPVEPPSWTGGASLSSGASTDKYASYIQMVRNNISKDSIKRQMMVAGLTQREIIAFFKAYPSNTSSGGQKSDPIEAVKLAPPLKIEKKIDSKKVSLPKPRQAGAKPLRISPVKSPTKKADSKRSGLFGMGTGTITPANSTSPTKSRPKPQSAASKNAKYFAELAKAEKQREEEEMARLDPDERARRLASRDEAKKHAEKKLAHYSKLNAVYYKSAGATISLSQNNPRTDQTTKYQQWLADTDPNNPKNVQNGQKAKSPPNSARSDKSTKSTSSIFSRLFTSKATI